MHYGIWQGAVGEMKDNSQAAGQASTLGKQAHCAQQRSHHSDSSSQPAAWADSDSKQATWTTTAPQTQSQSPAARIRQISPSSQQSQRRRAGPATQHGPGRREAQGAHRPNMGGPRTLAGDTRTTRKRGRAHLRGLVRQGRSYTRSFHLCTRRSNTHTQPSRNTRDQ